MYVPITNTSTSRHHCSACAHATVLGLLTHRKSIPFNSSFTLTFIVEKSAIFLKFLMFLSFIATYFDAQSGLWRDTLYHRSYLTTSPGLHHPVVLCIPSTNQCTCHRSSHGRTFWILIPVVDRLARKLHKGRPKICHSFNFIFSSEHGRVLATPPPTI